MRRAAVILAAAAVAVLVPAGPARACSCGLESPGGYVGLATVVFSGEVRAIEETLLGSPKAIIAVASVYKGDVPRVVRVDAGGRDEAACGVPFVRGRGYLIFTFGDSSALRTNLCTGTTDDTATLERAGVRPVKTYPPDAVAPLRFAAAPVQESRTIPVALAWTAAVLAAAAWFVLRAA